MYKLFLDDVRIPFDCAKYMHTRIGPDNLQYLENDWVIARNFDDFKTCYYTYGIPDIVSFDHDLGDEHYATNAELIKESIFGEIDYLRFKEKTGYDCAKFLMEECMAHHRWPSQIFIHTMNPVGYENIKNIVEFYYKHKND